MPSYRCAGLFYDGERGILLRDGREVALTPKARDLLLLLLSSSGRLLSREEIARRVWPDVVVTDNALSFQITELRRALADEAAFLTTVPRRGYRWDGAVESVAQVAAGAPAATTAPRWQGGDEPPASNTPPVRLAVLPLTVVGAPDPDPGIGLADLLGVRLSLLPGLVVRSTSEVLERLKHGRPETSALAQALGVELLVDGSMTRVGEAFEVRVRLLEAGSGRTLWAGAAHAAAVDDVAVEQRLGDELARALNLPLEQLAIERWAAPASADVAQIYWRAQALSLRGWRASKEALRLLATVNERDPNFAPAYTLAAQLFGLEVGYGIAKDPHENHRLSLAAAQRAVQLDPASPYARSVLGGAMADVGDLDAGAAQAAAARDAAPSRPSIHMLLGWLYRWAGLLDLAERAYETAFQIDPSLWRAGTHLAYVATLKRDQAKAEAALARLHEFGATADTAAWEMQAWRSYNLRAWAAAEAACARVLGRPEVLNYCERLRALLALRRGDPAPARQFLEKPGEASYPDGRRRFDRAAVLAALGETARTLTELEAAEQYGFQAPQALRFDPDLAALSGDERFQALVARWEERRRRREKDWR